MKATRVRVTRATGSTVAMVAALVLGGCATTNGSPFGGADGGTSSGQTQTDNRNLYAGYGVVNSVEHIQQEPGGIGGSGIGVGAVAGAVAGGIVGSQIGSGGATTAATIAGTAGGAYLGHEIEKRQRGSSADAYRISVRMNDGAYQALAHSNATDFRVGDRVRIGNGMLYKY
ncbi:glycine zipper 2TM domain-containing protein [Thioalkalicoccus limnaeus]|uniref:Glycine zipper 2TM domain-containing protein n=1 Tax=Thioalkalicoccus limnaeus TaxID=120681 RepID=A0ABV4BF68_9GAMM